MRLHPGRKLATCTRVRDAHKPELFLRFPVLFSKATATKEQLAGICIHGLSRQHSQAAMFRSRVYIVLHIRAGLYQ